MNTETFGEYIRQLRESQDMPLRKLAAVLDIDRTKHFEQIGKRRATSFQTDYPPHCKNIWARRKGINYQNL